MMIFDVGLACRPLRMSIPSGHPSVVKHKESGIYAFVPDASGDVVTCGDDVDFKEDIT
jgi:hypothetical protein